MILKKKVKIFDLILQTVLQEDYICGLMPLLRS